MYLAMSRKILREKNFPLKYKVIEIKSTYQIWSMDKRKRYFTIKKKSFKLSFNKREELLC